MDPIITQPEQLPASAPKHFLNKKFIVTFVILLLLGGTAYASIWYWQNQQVAQETVPTFTPLPSVSATLTPDTSTWKTYTNTQYGFEIQIPNDWTVVKENDSLAFKSQETIIAEAQNVIDCSLGSTKQCNSDGIPADMAFQPSSSMKDATHGEIQDIQTKNINGLQFTAYKVLGMIEIPTYEINYKNKIYNFSSISMNQVDFEHILGTLKFTDSNVQSGTGTLTGHVTIGPNCPVEQVGNPCTPSPQAYTSRQVMVYKADGTTLVTTQNFGTQGNYNIALPSGTYVIKSKTGIGSVASIVGTATIKIGQISTLNFNIDTGIR